MNHGKWIGDKEFPGLGELAHHLSPEAVLQLDDTYYREKIQPRFFYLKPDELWKWKVNALNFIRNNGAGAYRPNILAACSDENEKVRDMAKRIAEELPAE